MSGGAITESVWLLHDGRAVVQPPIDIDIYSCVQLRGDLANAAALTKTGDVVIDLTSNEFCDSSGLGAFIAARKRATTREPHGTVFLVGVPNRIRATLHRTGIESLFELVDTLEQLPPCAESPVQLWQAPAPASAEANCS